MLGDVLFRQQTEQLALLVAQSLYNRRISAASAQEKLKFS
jgi:hypothetical protein